MVGGTERQDTLGPETVDTYARAIRTMGEHFDWQIDTLSENQLTGYFRQRIASHSWSAVKLDLYGYKFYVVHVLPHPWSMPGLIRPPKTRRLPDIVTVEQAQALFGATRVLSYRVFFVTVYSPGLRLSEGLAPRPPCTPACSYPANAASPVQGIPPIRNTPLCVAV